MRAFRNSVLILWCCLMLGSFGYGEGKPTEITSFIGVCSQVTRETPKYNPFQVHQTLMDTIKSANIHFTRFGFKWHTIHPRPGVWDWRIADAVVASAKERDLQILALLSGMPKYVFESPSEHIDLWMEFVDSLSARYDEDIFHWELWNEPNLRNGKYWPQSELPLPYANYVIEASKRIRSNQPNATILLGGLATNQRSKPFELWESLFKLGVLEFVDGIAYHTYQYSGKKLIGLNNRLSGLVGRYSDVEKEFWITEYGVPGTDSEAFPQISYSTQRQELMKSILTHWAMGGNQFFVFSIWDKAPFIPNQTRKELRKTRTYFYGLLEKNMTPKPSYFDLKWLSHLLQTYKPLEIEAQDDGVLISLRHNQDESIAYFSWGKNSQQQLLTQAKTLNLSSCETREFQKSLTSKRLRRLKLPEDEVLFWK